MNNPGIHGNGGDDLRTAVQFWGDSNDERLQGRGEFSERRREQPISEADSLFPPRRYSHEWQSIVKRTPERLPSLEPGICRVDNGLSTMVDPSDYAEWRLRCMGNAVVPQCAAYAFIVLYQRMKHRHGNEV